MSLQQMFAPKGGSSCQSSKAVERVKIYGERQAGTTLLTDLIRRNFSVPLLSGTPNERAAAFVLLVPLLAGSPSHAVAGASSRCSDAAVMEGCGIYYWPDGTRYVGGFHGGFFDGPATVTFPDGARLEITFQSGAVASGNATYVDRDGKVISGPLHDVSRDLAHPHGPIDYPFWRAFFGDQTDVMISAIVNQYGVVTAAGPYGKVDSESFAKAAVEGIKQWHYVPATIDGKPVPMPYLIEVQFAQAR